MKYFIAIDTYNHISRYWFGLKKRNKPTEVRPVTISIVSAGGDIFTTQFRVNLKDDTKWDGCYLSNPKSAKEALKSLGDWYYQREKNSVHASEIYTSSLEFKLVAAVLSDVRIKDAVCDMELYSFEAFLIKLCAYIEEAEFGHDNPNYPNAINLLPGENMSIIQKTDMLEEHKLWQHTAPGDLSLERARKTRNNYLLIEGILDKYKK